MRGCKNTVSIKKLQTQTNHAITIVLANIA